jgi:threonine dehydrogenase-like Zn-dependent dehydrogenase
VLGHESLGRVLQDPSGTLDIVLECTGVDDVVVDVIGILSPDGIACLTGVSTGRHPLRLNIRR